MKLLVALMVFMFVAQPVPAGFCDLDLSGAADPHASMQHDQEANASSHDCCQPADADDPGQGCSDMPCGTCTAGFQAVSFATTLAAWLPTARESILSDGQISPSHSSPPFRPPTLIS